MTNLATMRPAAELGKLPSRYDLLGDHARKTQTEIVLLDEQRRMSISLRTDKLVKARQLRDEIVKLDDEIATEALRTEAIDKLLRVRRHMLADLESDRA